MFKNTKVAVTIFAVCIVPLLVVVGLCAAAIVNNVNQASRVQQVSAFVAAVPEMAALITTLQKERGFSVGFVR